MNNYIRGCPSCDDSLPAIPCSINGQPSNNLIFDFGFVWFKTNDSIEQLVIRGLDGEKYELKSNCIYRIPLIHAQILEKAKVGRVLKPIEIEYLTRMGILPNNLDDEEGAGLPVYVHIVNIQRNNIQLNVVDGISVKAVDLIHNYKNIAFLNNYVSLIKPTEDYVKFIAWLYELQYEIAEVLSSADLIGLTRIRCLKTKRFVDVPKLSNVGQYNPFRGIRSAKSSSSRFVNKLLQLSGLGVDYLIKITLTFPKEFSIKALDDFDFCVKKAKDCFRTFIKLLRKSYCRNRKDKLGGFYNIHPWSTKEPKEPHFHIHLGFVNVVLVDNRFVRFRPFLDEKKIKELWKKALEENGVNIDCTPDVWIGYIKLVYKAGVMHWVKYSSRKPMVDIFEYYTENEFKVEELEDRREYLLRLMCYENRRVPFGFFTRLSNYVKPAPEYVCPICGSEAEKVGVVDIEGYYKTMVDEDIKLFIWNKSKRYVMFYIERLGGICDYG